MSLSVLICADNDHPRLASLRQLLEADGFSCHVMSCSAPNPKPKTEAAIIFDDNSDAALRQIAQLRGSSVVTFAVSADASRERFGKLMAFGSTGVLPPDVSDERIAAEVEALDELRQSTEGEGPNQALQPFLAATLEAWSLMAGSKARLSGLRAKSEFRMPGEVTALIYLFGNLERVLSLSMSYEAAQELTHKVLGDAMPDPDIAMVHDTLAEMSNVVAGQVKGRFDGTTYEFDISTPTVIAGSPHHLMHRPDLPCYEMAFTSDCGVFHIQLCVRGRDVEKK